MAYPIIEREELAAQIVRLRIRAPRIARAALPGQFVMVRADEQGERIPLTLADYDVQQGWIELVVQTVGVSTSKIGALPVGAGPVDVAGPLGRPSAFTAIEPEVLRRRTYLFIGGGVGTAPVYPQVKWLRERGVAADVIVGARTRSALIYTGALEKVARTLYIATDDGSMGYHGQVTGLLRELVGAQGLHYDEAVAIGPMVMMKFVASATWELGLPTTVSLNALMVDGTGMCGACRVTVGGRVRFTCVDGPEFDAHAVDWDEAMRRQRMFRAEERAALSRHQCHCTDAAGGEVRTPETERS